MAPRPDLLTDLGREFIAMLPPVLRDDPDYIAVMHCAAKEMERLRATAEQARAELNPQTAGDVGLAFWEALLRLPVRPSGLTVDDRRTRVIARYHSLDGDPSGVSMADRITQRIGGALWSYEEHIPGDGASPAAQTLRIHLPWEPASPDWNNALVVIREEVPAELALSFVSDGGFRLDESQMDVEGMGI